MVRFVCLASLGLLVGACAPAGADLFLAKAGRTDYTIVIAPDASPSERHGAQELQMFLKKITGADFPLATEAVKGPMLLVGRSPALEALKVSIPWEALGDEGFVIKTVGPHIVLAGGRLRGSMYAVYTFLEDYLGCRWFSSQVSHIPIKHWPRIPQIDEQQVPRLEYRDVFYTDAFDADFAARNKINGGSSRLDEKRGGKVAFYPFVHSFYYLMPPEEFFAEHPEYYSMIDGKRTAQGAQLCLTNPEVVRIVTERVKELIRQHPGTTIHSVSQNDCEGWCECPTCKALDEAEGSHAATVINFVNQIAEAIEQEFPGHAIDTLAYMYTRKPPKTIKPRHNVIVRLCSIECCFAHPLDSCPINESFRNDIIGWSKLTNRLYVWDYVTDFFHYLLPYPNLRVLQPNIQFFVNHGVKGIFEQGNYAPGGGGEMAELRAYLLAKLLWNPDYDVDHAMHEFLDYYYGPAAEPIHEYLKMLHDKVEQENIHLNISTGPKAEYLDEETLARANALFDEAERRCARDPRLLQRVKVARLPIQYVMLSRAPLVFDGQALISQRGADYTRLLDDFMAVVRKAGIQQHREGRSIANWEREMRSSIGGSLPAFKAANSDLLFVLIPGLGGRIFSITHKPTGRQILYQPEVEFAGAASVRGYEEYLGSSYRGRGWLDAFEMERTLVGDGPQTIVMSAELQSEHCLWRRAITIPPQGSRFTIESSLTNIGDHPRWLTFRVHPEFACQVKPSTRVALLQADGSWLLRGLPLDGHKDQFFDPEMAAGGQWALLQPEEGWGIVQSFDPRQVSLLLLNSYPQEGRVNLELYSTGVDLPPQESLSLKVTYEYVTDLTPWQAALQAGQ